MTNYVIDTATFRGAVKGIAHGGGGVITWMQGLPSTDKVHVSELSIAAVRSEILASKTGVDLNQWLQQLAHTVSAFGPGTFSSRTLPVTDQVLEHWSQLRVDVSGVDDVELVVMATALAHGIVYVGAAPPEAVRLGLRAVPPPP